MAMPISLAIHLESLQPLQFFIKLHDLLFPLDDILSFSLNLPLPQIFLTNLSSDLVPGQFVLPGSINCCMIVHLGLEIVRCGAWRISR